jgi:hypothetical protein
MRGFSRSRTLTTLLCLLPIALVQAQRNSQNAQAAYISGAVQGAQGPEAGVWVIAETKDLPTNFIKIVVTDDRGRFMLPDLPSATYNVWVRGYGLVDSTPIQTKPTADAITLQATPPRARRKRRRSIRATTGCRCSSRRARRSFRALARRATGWARTCRPRTTGSTR